MALYIAIFFISSACSSSFLHCAAIDTDSIATGSSVNDTNGDTLVSAGKRFQLGFFSPQNNTKHGRYLGIWYHEDPETVVWIANRDKPLSDSTGTFVIWKDGNLKVLDGNDSVHFSTTLDSVPMSPLRTVKLLDSGNLVLSDDQQDLWQSFNFPTDTFLPGMKMDENLKLTSWISDEDPKSGNFTFQLDQEDENRFSITKNGSILYWRSEDTDMFSAATFLLSNFSDNENPLEQKKKSGGNHAGLVHGNPISYRDLVRPQDYNKTRLLMAANGEIQFFNWNNGTRSIHEFPKNNGTWSLRWLEPQDRCNVYRPCGRFGVCSITNEPMCKCLPHFEPSVPDNWDFGHFSDGCTRRSTKCDKNSRFLNLTSIRVEKPDIPKQEVENETVCMKNCRMNCDCQAYTYNEVNSKQNRTPNENRTPNQRNSCWIWTSDLFSLRQDRGGGYNLSVRVSINDTDFRETKPEEGKGRLGFDKPVVIFTTVIVAVLLLCGISYIFYKRMRIIRQGRRESNEENPVLRLYDSERRVKDLIDSSQFEEEDKKGIDVPHFNLETILAATDSFSDANKLGQGGFGPVYKGKFPGGQQIAVKRLSIHSGQGLEEFKNEVVLIAKLQHRNLVRLLGYCIRGDEKILLYEYMPNKSLDTFIFDQTASILLDWEKRFDIIWGVARGLLYLHEDSRLRIIHRDLKTSNILLDEEMNPKISDFGLARIVGGKETEANTNRVVGTYGYMSPEYALDGLFSIKSDVFSFGVVVLEIISGKRNTGFHRSQRALNLLGHAWRLWKEEKTLDLIDRAVESCNTSEVLKCIVIGLLCVQEDPGDRPTMSTVVFMLGSEISTLPSPKQPAFVVRKSLSTTPSTSSNKTETQSNNALTFTIEDGR